jgi:glycosyltransferase involved in cell wall biosynthesis
VVFHGRLAKDELHDLLRSCAVAAVPSRWFENQPMAVLEALGCGVPVVATDLGGLPELVRPGVDGELVPADDHVALGDAMAKLVGDPQLAFEMGRAGRARILEEFSPELHLERLAMTYAEAGAVA